nr:PREDICTED: uncharacterized protein LOC109038476 [Bemisia tabaci]
MKVEHESCRDKTARCILILLLYVQATSGSPKRSLTISGSQTRPTRRLPPESGYEYLDTLATDGRLQPGFVFSHRHYGKLLILPDQRVAVMEADVCPFQTRVEIYSVLISQIIACKNPQVKQILRGASQETLNMRVAIALRVVRRHLPYHPVYCNKTHWWDFILHGKRHTSWFMHSCPLNRSWVGYTADAVTDGRFTFLDGRSRELADFPHWDMEAEGTVNFCCIGRGLRFVPMPTWLRDDGQKTWQLSTWQY